MANFTRTQPDGTWVAGYQVTPADLGDLSWKASAGVNLVVGGVYAPTSPIVVNGSGLELGTPLEVRGSGVLRFVTGATLTVEDTDDFQLLEPNHPGRVRELYTAMAPVRVVGEDRFAIANLVPMGAVQPLASQLRRAKGVAVPEFVKELRVHNGATLASITVSLRVPTPHPAVPQAQPKIRVFRVRIADGVDESLSSASRDGFVPLGAPKSGTEWHAGGEVQRFTVALNQNNVIDRSQYVYYLHIVEERAGIDEYPFELPIWEADDIKVASAGPNLETGDVDNFGVAWPAGTPALFKDQVNQAQNGVWTSPGGAGPWARHAALSAQPHFQNGTLFVVNPKAIGAGKSNPGTVWQMTLPPPFFLGVSRIQITHPVPKGTIFLGFKTRFENIRSTAFQ